MDGDPICVDGGSGKVAGGLCVDGDEDITDELIPTGKSYIMYIFVMGTRFLADLT